MADSDTDVFEILCRVNGERKKTHELSKHEAICFRTAAQHLVKYLTETYDLEDFQVMEDTPAQLDLVRRVLQSVSADLTLHGILHKKTVAEFATWFAVCAADPEYVADYLSYSTPGEDEIHDGETFVKRIRTYIEKRILDHSEKEALERGMQRLLEIYRKADAGEHPQSD